MVAAARTNAAIPTSSGSVTCRKRSPVLSAWIAFPNAQNTARIYGGAVSRSEMILLYPSVWTTVGKKFVTDAALTTPSSINTRIQTLTSLIARVKPWKND